MESADKRKIIIIVASVAFSLLGIIVVFATLPGEEKEDELSVRVQDEREVTVEDMMKSGDGKSENQTGAIQESTPALSAGTSGAGTLPQTSDEIVEDNAEVRELQKQLRTKRNTIWMAIQEVLLPEHTHILLYRLPPRLQNGDKP